MLLVVSDNVGHCVGYDPPVVLVVGAGPGECSGLLSPGHGREVPTQIIFFPAVFIRKKYSLSVV